MHFISFVRTSENECVLYDLLSVSGSKKMFLRDVYDQIQRGGWKLVNAVYAHNVHSRYDEMQPIVNLPYFGTYKGPEAENACFMLSALTFLASMSDVICKDYVYDAIEATSESLGYRDQSEAMATIRSEDEGMARLVWPCLCEMINKPKPVGDELTLTARADRIRDRASEIMDASVRRGAMQSSAVVITECLQALVATTAQRDKDTGQSDLSTSPLADVIGLWDRYGKYSTVQDVSGDLPGIDTIGPYDVVANFLSEVPASAASAASKSLEQQVYDALKADGWHNASSKESILLALRKSNNNVRKAVSLLTRVHGGTGGSAAEAKAKQIKADENLAQQLQAQWAKDYTHRP